MITALEANTREPIPVPVLEHLAFLAPDIVKAAVEGTLPRGLGLSDMTDLSMDWNEQRRALGLVTPASRGAV